jgi:hypothetical protein
MGQGTSNHGMGPGTSNHRGSSHGDFVNEVPGLQIVLQT